MIIAVTGWRHWIEAALMGIRVEIPAYKESYSQ